MTFFTADSHFGHDNIRKYDKRPFATIEEHDRAIVDNWNRYVTKDDIVYHLGDFSFCSKAGGATKYFDQLNGRMGARLANVCEWLGDEVQRTGVD